MMGDRDYRITIKNAIESISRELEVKIDSDDFKTINLKDGIGLKYIHHLLNNQNKEFYVLELVRKTKKSLPFLIALMERLFNISKTPLTFKSICRKKSL